MLDACIVCTHPLPLPPLQPLSSSPPPPTCSIQRNHDGSPIPPVVRECVTYIERYGLDVLGIFRRSPSMQVVHDLKAAINRGEACLVMHSAVT